MESIRETGDFPARLYEAARQAGSRWAAVMGRIGALERGLSRAPSTFARGRIAARIRTADRRARRLRVRFARACLALEDAGAGGLAAQLVRHAFARVNETRALDDALAARGELELAAWWLGADQAPGHAFPAIAGRPDRCSS